MTTTPKAEPAEAAAPLPSAAPPRWRLGERAALTLLVLVFGLEAWAWWGTDPDFYLPDPFRVVVLAVIAVVALSGWIRWTRLR